MCSSFGPILGASASAPPTATAHPAIAHIHATIRAHFSSITHSLLMASWVDRPPFSISSPPQVSRLPSSLSRAHPVPSPAGIRSRVPARDNPPRNGIGGRSRHADDLFRRFPPTPNISAIFPVGSAPHGPPRSPLFPESAHAIVRGPIVTGSAEERDTTYHYLRESFPSAKEFWEKLTVSGYLSPSMTRPNRHTRTQSLLPIIPAADPSFPTFIAAW